MCRREKSFSSILMSKCIEYRYNCDISVQKNRSVFIKTRIFDKHRLSNGFKQIRWSKMTF